MANDISTPLRGKISAVSSCGRFGVVTLDAPEDGHNYAVINDETKGRVALLSSTKKGVLQQDTRVVIQEAERGSEAFRALQVVRA